MFRQGARKYTGMVEDCCCDYETVDAINEEVLNPILQDLVALPFFRYFKVSKFCSSVFNGFVMCELAYGKCISRYFGVKK